MPLAIIVGGLILGGLLANYNWDLIYGKQITVLGMKGSGKTTWYHFLGANVVPGEGTRGKVDLNSFIINVPGKGFIRIKKSHDVGGGEDSIGLHYKELLENSAKVFFFFDAEQYLHAKGYAEQVHARLDFIKFQLDKNQGESWQKEHVVLVMTRADKLNHSEAKEQEIVKRINDRNFSSLTQHTYLVDARNKKELEAILKEFKK